MDTERISRGLTLITIGGVCLAMALGQLPWSAWWGAASLWPLLIVSAGIDIIGRATHQSWLRIMALLVVILGVLYGVLVIPNGLGSVAVRDSAASSFNRSEPHSMQVTRGVAVISGGAGRLSVFDGADLVSVQGATALGSPAFSVVHKGATAQVNVGFGDTSVWQPSVQANHLDVQLDRDVVWDVRVDTGASETSVDLSALKLSSFSLDAGASDADITLGTPAAQAADDPVSVSINCGVSSLKVRVPRSAAVRLRVDGALNSTEVSGSLSKTSAQAGQDVWESAGYGSGARYDIVVKSGLGSIRLITY